MNDTKWIIAGLVIFILMFTFPLWYNHLQSAPPPEPKLTDKAKAAKVCVAPNMKVEHMQLLDVWRNAVVRGGKRIYLSRDGREFNMSLTNTCLDCHSQKAEFCDKCHNYASVSPYCWDCHIDPQEKK